VRTVRHVAIATASLVLGWALVTAAESRAPAEVHYQVVVRTVEVEVEREPWPEPEQPDHMTDGEWAEFQRESACLYDLMRDRGMEFTLETVTAADVWTEANGGACAILKGDER